nr:serine-threonine/tyrosine-protein kinase catalytic domain-containing protein [Tanacetum cinerariifolium]
MNLSREPKKEIKEAVKSRKLAHHSKGLRKKRKPKQIDTQLAKWHNYAIKQEANGVEKKHPILMIGVVGNTSKRKKSFQSKRIGDWNSKFEEALTIVSGERVCTDGEGCLHSHPKQRPTMAKVMVGLESMLALQEKANSTLQRARGMRIFRRKV